MLRILQSVGYPSANKSHFASIDLWSTGNDGNSWNNGKDSGWMGRFMEEAYSNLLPSNFPLEFSWVQAIPGLDFMLNMNMV